jgi:hypothetical protein
MFDHFYDNKLFIRFFLFQNPDSKDSSQLTTSETTAVNGAAAAAFVPNGDA